MRCGPARLQTRAGALPSLFGTNSAASFSQEISSSWPEGKVVPMHRANFLNYYFAGSAVHKRSNWVDMWSQTWGLNARMGDLVWDKSNVWFLCFSYASIWKGCLTLYTGRGGDLQKIGEWVASTQVYLYFTKVDWLAFWLSYIPCTTVIQGQGIQWSMSVTCTWS